MSRAGNERASFDRPAAVVLVEGVSDKLALETLVQRRGRDLAAETVSVVSVGGAQAFGRFLTRYGPRGSSLPRPVSATSVRRRW
jgi:hypothetical protein